MSTDLLRGTVQTLKNTRGILSAENQNFGKASIPDAIRDDVYTVMSQSGGVTRTSVVHNYAANEHSNATRRKNFSELGKSETISNSLDTYQNIFGGSTPTEFQLLSRLDGLIAQFGGLPNNNNIATKQAVLDKGQAFSASLNSAIKGMKGTRDMAHREMLTQLQEANTAIKQLHDLNQQLQGTKTKTAASSDLITLRDQQLNKLSKYFSIEIVRSPNEAAYVKLASGRYLVNVEGYSKFSTTGALVQEAHNMSKPEDMAINLTSLTHEGKAVSTQVVQGGKDNKNEVRGGSIEGYTILRDDKLAHGLEIVRGIRDSAAKAFNDVHNDGSTWPPATSMIGEMWGAAKAFDSLSGVMTVSSLDKGGKQLTGNGGRIHERHIDFDNLRTDNADGKVSIWDAINEFNRVMDTNLTRERAAIGQLTFQDALSPDLVQKSDKEFLINNMMLASACNSDDRQNGAFRFDFEIDGNSFFGSNVEIKSVEVDGTILNNYNPQSFRVEKDFAGRIGTEISTAPLTAGDHDIDITVVVKGDNGVSHTGKVRYKVNKDDLPPTNQRLQHDTATPLEGDFVRKSANQTGVGRLRFVDKDDVDIIEGDKITVGRLMYESNTAEHGIAFRGSNLMSLAGLNNFFSIIGDDISVRPSILADPSKLSGGQVSKGEGSTIATKIGDDKASASIQINDGGNNLAAGDTIFIGNLGDPTAAPPVPAFGTTITLIAPPGPAAAGQAVVGANLDATIENIKNALNADSLFNERFVATKVAGNTLKVEAIEGGTWAHEVDVRVNITNPLVSSSINDSDAVAGGIGVNHNSKFIGGTDKDEAIKVYNYTIGEGSTSIFTRLAGLNQEILSFAAIGGLSAGSGTLHSQMSDALSMLVNQKNDANADKELKESVAEKFDLDFREKFGIDKDETLMKIMNYTNLMGLQAKLYSLVSNATNKVNDIIATAA